MRSFQLHVFKNFKKGVWNEDENVRDFPAVSHCYPIALHYFPVIGEELYATLFQEVHLCRANLHLSLHLETPVLLITETQQAVASFTLTAMWCVKPYNELFMLLCQNSLFSFNFNTARNNMWLHNISHLEFLIKSLHTPKLASASLPSH